MPQDFQMLTVSIRISLIPVFDLLVKQYNERGHTRWCYEVTKIKSSILQNPHAYLGIDKLPRPEKLTAIIDKLFEEFVKQASADFKTCSNKD
ncbi:hypothetical protein [Chryseolinea lacunae]|uniref:Uncharacterized protein n=1 Tax=Chryseolinea lacunae TaxID=2801331 RepID=A0ABS1L2Q0_9BACT|nr:hypothetical protein [Chryseolinea lacunae]MBL0745808.1 hypothetical protein [Chryseolinea lacunae]